jgi:hypothetical protein
MDLDVGAWGLGPMDVSIIVPPPSAKRRRTGSHSLSRVAENKADNAIADIDDIVKRCFVKNNTGRSRR